jgi:hypothetical protein
MPVKTVMNCKICRSELRTKIEAYIRKRTPGPAIISYALANGLTISPKCIANHRKHIKLTPKEIEEKTKKLRAKEAARVRFGQAAAAVVSANKCLEDIITSAYHRMEKGEVKPTIDNALKAIELQAKLKESGRLENAIIDFMLEFSREPLNGHQQTALSNGSVAVIPYQEQPPEQKPELSAASEQPPQPEIPETPPSTYLPNYNHAKEAIYKARLRVRDEQARKDAGAGALIDVPNQPAAAEAAPA